MLNALARYVAVDEKESEHICERVVPQFQHANGSVVLAAVKVGAMLLINALAQENIAGHHDSYERREAGRVHQTTCPEDGTTSGYSLVITT